MTPGPSLAHLQASPHYNSGHANESRRMPRRRVSSLSGHHTRSCPHARLQRWPAGRAPVRHCGVVDTAYRIVVTADAA